MPLFVTTFYRFAILSPEDAVQFQTHCDQFAHARDMRGLVLLGTEGINGTVCGTSAAVQEWKHFLRGHAWFHDVEFKDSTCDVFPFRMWKTQIRSEIVTLGDPSIHPLEANHRHLSPNEWNTLLKHNADEVVLLDTRNRYETDIGKFKNAVAPDIKDFQEFPSWLKQNALPKDKTIMIYCTGGIRCEKAIYAMEQQGYQNVVQLQGGILNYLDKHPHEEFEGECFVFDRRVAVQQDLQPTQTYKTCSHCGQPSSLDVNCDRCGHDGPMCKTCEEKFQFKACSKNCAYHLEKKPNQRGRKQMLEPEGHRSGRRFGRRLGSSST